MSSFSAISCVTYSVPNLADSRDAFIEHLGYRPVIDEPIPPKLAERWNTPAVANQRYCLLQPASDEAVFIRLVESPTTPGYAPLKHFGWNAAELHVQDVYGLAKRLADSPFRVIGGPRDLLNDGTVVALQVLGPGDELLYLTQISAPAMNATYGQAQAEVGRLFIAVLGSSNLPRSTDFYGPLAQHITPAKAFSIRVLAHAHGLDPFKAVFNIASVVFDQAFRIEMDSYPATASPKPQVEGQLAPGLSILTVSAPMSMAKQLSEHCEFSAGPSCLPYEGRPVGLLRGPDGETLEIILQD